MKETPVPIESIDLNRVAVGKMMVPRGKQQPTTDLRPTIIALDPGETTGWSLIRVDLKVLSDRLDLSNNIVLHQHGQIDCGKTQGALDVMDKSDPGLNADGEARGVERILYLIDQNPDAAIIVEDFIVNMRKLTKARHGLSPVRITARLEQELWHRNRYILRQSVSDAKGSMNDERLKEFDRYQRTGGLNHARDADRHAMLFLRKCQTNAQLRHLAWPQTFDEPEVKVKRTRKPKPPGTRIQFG